MEMNQLETIVKKIFTLKPVSPVVHKVLAAVGNPDVTVSEFAELITYDLALTANVLKMANSSFFGRKQKINNVIQACSFLGTDKVFDLVLMSCFSDTIIPSQLGYDLGEGELWKNSASVALMARTLAAKENGCDTQLVFTSALLKDIGKIVLNQYVGDAFEEIMSRVSEKGSTFEEAEKQVIGIDHATLGAMVARTWHFSFEMQDIIQNHHHPLQAKKCIKEASIVHMADSISMMMGLGIGSDGLSYRFDKKVADQMQIPDYDIAKMIADFSDIHQHVQAIMSMA